MGEYEDGPNYDAIMHEQCLQCRAQKPRRDMLEKTHGWFCDSICYATWYTSSLVECDGCRANELAADVHTVAGYLICESCRDDPEILFQIIALMASELDALHEMD